MKSTKFLPVLIATAAIGLFIGRAYTADVVKPAVNDGGLPSARKSPTAEVLEPDPNRFFGKALTGYESAKQAPEMCAKLFCYCGCDMTDKHKSLLDCFTSDHGADCEICQDEAIIALDLKKDGKSIAAIQQAVDEKFAKEYPFDHPSAELLQYRKARLWHPTKPEAGARKFSSQSNAGAPKLLAGKKIGNCCGMHKTK